MKPESMVRKVVPLLSVLLLLLASACAPTENGGQLEASADPMPLGLGSDPDHPALQNVPGSLGHEIDTGWSVRAGDQIEIRPSCIDHERRTVPKSVVTRTDQSVCVKEIDVCTADEPVFQPQCKERCNLCMKCEFLFFCREGFCCNTTCTNVEVGRRCIRTERRCAEEQNQWLEETLHGELGPSTRERNTNPMDETALMLSGLKLKLIFSGASAEEAAISCPISEYQPKLDSDRITVTLGDQPGCPASFAAHPGEAARLSVVNEMNEPIHYVQGVQVKSWDGKLIEQPTPQTYLPEIGFEGVLTLLRRAVVQ